jgi:hypothetical protein
MSPHFGLIDQTLPVAEKALLRAQLHWRCGMRRLQEKKISAGIVTLYDALLSAMRYHILADENLDKNELLTEQLENERYVFNLLRKKGIIDHALDLNEIEALVDKALMEEDIVSGEKKFIRAIEQFLVKMKVLPFAETKLPPEDPDTF